jgi:hypothetical protein
VELNKRFLEGYNHFKDEPRLRALRTNVLKYNRLVRDLGLRDHQVRFHHTFYVASLNFIKGASRKKG